MKPAAFHLEALAELQEQAVFHEERSAGLGERFAAQVEAAVSLAASMPGVGSPYRHGTGTSAGRIEPELVVSGQLSIEPHACSSCA